MDFQNNSTLLSDVPKLERGDFNALEKDYLWLRLTSFGILYLLLMGCVFPFIFIPKVAWWMTFAPITVLFGLIFLLEVRGFKIRGYALREKDVSYKSGLLFFSMASVPFNRIQHTEVTQGPLARLFDLATVKVYTAGGSSSDITISGLKKEDAHTLKDHITKISSQYA